MWHSIISAQRSVWMEQPPGSARHPTSRKYTIKMVTKAGDAENSLWDLIEMGFVVQ